MAIIKKGEPIMKKLYPLYLSLFLLMILFFNGCGSGQKVGDMQNEDTPAQAGLGKIAITIDWPSAQQGTARVLNKIPSLSQGLQIKIVQGNITIADCINKTTQTKIYDSIPAGQTTVTADALPFSDCSGVVMANASTSIDVVANITTTVPLTLASTIKKVEVTPGLFDIMETGNTELNATAKNAAGQIVLVPVDGWFWSSSSLLNASACQSDSTKSTCKVTGILASDPVAITATVSEFNDKSGTSTGKVVARSTPKAGDWPQPGHDPAHTGLAGFILMPPLNPEPKWTYNPNGPALTSPVAIGGRVFLGGSDGRVFAIDIDSGTLLWTYSTTSPNCCHITPVVADVASSDHDILFITYAENSLSTNPSIKLLALDTLGGDKIWEQDIIGSLHSVGPSVVDSTNIYIPYKDTLGNYKLLAYSTGGTKTFDVSADNISSFRPAVDSNTVYLPGNQLRALNTTGGAVKWNYPLTVTESWSYATPVISGGVVYGLKSNGEIVAINDNGNNGTKKWSYNLASSYTSALLAINSNTLFVNTSAGKLIAIDKDTGVEKWETTSLNYSALAVSGNTLYAVKDCQAVEARDISDLSISKGTLRWSISNNSCGTDMIPAGEMLLIKFNNTLKAFEATSGGGSVGIIIY